MSRLFFILCASVYFLEYGDCMLNRSEKEFSVSALEKISVPTIFEGRPITDQKELEIKQVSEDELGLLLDWRIEVLREVFSVPVSADMSKLRSSNEDYYKKSLTNGSHIACFAQLDKEIIGCGGVCLYQEMPSPDNLSGLCAYIMNIYVRKAHRRKGIGRQIIQWLIDRTRSQGITKIYLESSKIAISLYKDIGFVPMEDMLILKK